MAVALAVTAAACSAAPASTEMFITVRNRSGEPLRMVLADPWLAGGSEEAVWVPPCTEDRLYARLAGDWSVRVPDGVELLSQSLAPVGPGALHLLVVRDGSAPPQVASVHRGEPPAGWVSGGRRVAEWDCAAQLWKSRMSRVRIP